MRLRRALNSMVIGAAAVALVLIPTAGSNNGDAFIIGSENNFAGARTHLVSSAADQALLVSDDSGVAGFTGVRVIYGEATSPDGLGTGVYGVSGAHAGEGVEGYLSQTNPFQYCTLGCAGDPAGVVGRSDSQNALGPGVYGIHSSFSGSAPGVLGETHSASGYGVEGINGVGGFSDFGTAVRGESGDPMVGAAGDNGVVGVSHNKVKSGVYGEDPQGGYGVLGRSSGDAAGGQNQGVYGWVYATAPVATAAGVRGQNDGTNANGYGVWGSHAGSGIGVLGTTPTGLAVVGASGFVGVLGYAPRPGLAGYFLGDVNVTGTLTKGAGAFRIDHPLDPAHKYLQHSFVESPDMMDVYNGNVTTDSKGFAVVKLPGYFQALNRSFRYQLTIVGRSFAQAIVWKEIANNNFTIKTNQPEVKVSWQVTGIRHDAYANAHRIPVVVQKPAADQGKYLHPELYGKPASASVVPKQAAKALAQARR